jgi:hypothetical protein
MSVRTARNRQPRRAFNKEIAVIIMQAGAIADLNSLCKKIVLTPLQQAAWRLIPRAGTKRST